MFPPISNPASLPPTNPIATCAGPPADPNGPDMRQNPNVERGPNDFTLGINGPDPMLEVGGTQDDQERQRDFLLALTGRAALSYASREQDGMARLPTDGQVEQTLGQLERNPPIGTDGREVTRAVYQSTIPNASAQQAFEYFINNPNEVFNAGGMEIRPPTERLEDGGRYMLEVGGPPPTWLPIEITVDAANNAFTISTLDGHVLRGEQTFTFADSCDGSGATLTQDARFQASTPLVGDLQNIVPISNEQHKSWQFAHREIYEQFNGDPDYKGMGIDFDANKWRQFAIDVIKDPGKTANVFSDGVGELANGALDSIGRLINDGADRVASGVDQAMDGLGIPGGDTVEKVIDTAGNVVEGGIDLVGDGVSWVADRFGDGAEALIDTAGNVVEGGIDLAGDGVSWVADRFGDGAEALIDTAGNVVEGGIDLVGDGVNWVADKVGDRAKAVIDFVNPFD